MKQEEIAKLQKIYNHWLDTDPTPSEQVGWSGDEDQHGRFAEIVDAIKVSGKGKKFSILDIGCGDGALLDFLYEHLEDYEFHYTGIDINDRYLARAREMYQGSKLHATFIEGDFEAMDFKKKFDFVVASGTYNVNVFKEKSDAYAMLDRVIPKMAQLARVAVIFNLLTNRTSGEVYLTDDMIVYDKRIIVKDCEKFGKVSLREGYDPHDSTFVIQI